MSKKFILFGGCFGDGLTICNKAVIENGDYKKIAHISNGGRITWYIKDPKNYVPDMDMRKIEEWSQTYHNQFMERWAAYSDLKKYTVMIDNMPYTDLLEHSLKKQLKECSNLHEKVCILQKIYLENYI